VTAFGVTDPREVGPVLERALEQKGTVCVEIRCDPDEQPAYLRDWIEDV
jgi:thiamine pyrophosphate-dependent acetolactate synthase large subunit-like protein